MLCPCGLASIAYQYITPVLEVGDRIFLTELSGLWGRRSPLGLV